MAQNFVCMEIHKNQIKIFLKIDAETLENKPAIVRDMRDIGHSGTGDLECSVQNQDDLETAKKLILVSFENIGE